MTARGFTLVELLVAMTVLGLIALSLLSSLRLGATVWQRSDGQGRSVEQIELAATTLRSTLTAAYPFLAAADPTDIHILFDGTAQHIRFLAPAPDALGGAGLARFDVAAEPGENGLRLTIAATPELANDGFAVRRPAVLLDGLDRLSFGYYGPDQPGSVPSWHESWADRSSLPRMIRISAGFAPGDSNYWPELIVAPQIAADEGCVFDPLGHRCQGR